MKRFVPSTSTHRLLMAAIAALLASPFARATNLYWDINGTDPNTGASANGNWSGATNVWNTDSDGDGGAMRSGTTASDLLTFSSGSNFTGTSLITVSGSSKFTDGLVFQEGTVTLTGSGFVDFGSSTGEIDVNTGLTATIESNVAGSVGITKTGAGTLILGINSGNDGSNNTFLNGTIHINAGRLVANSGNTPNPAPGTAPFGNATNGLPIFLGDTSTPADATFSVNRNRTYNSAVTLNAVSSGILRLSPGPDLTAQQAPTISGAITLNNNVTLGNGSAGDDGGIRLSGVITGNKTITADGRNDFTTPQAYTANYGTGAATSMAQISGNNAASFTGNVVVQRGSLEIQHVGALGTGTATVTTADGGVLNLNANSIQIAGLTGSGGSVSNLDSGPSGTFNDPDPNPNDPTSFTTADSLSILTLKGPNAYSYGGSIIDGTTGTTGFTLKVGLTVDMGSTGSQTLTGVNNYTGGTIINSGKLIIGSTVGNVSLGDTTGSASATFSLNDKVTFNSAVTVNGGSTGIKRISTGPGVTFSGVSILNGNTTLNGDVTLGNGSGGTLGTLRLNGTISGGGNITVDGTNTFTTPQNYTTNFNTATGTTRVEILATGASFTGDVAVQRGALVIQNTTSIGSGTAIVSTAAGGVLNLNNQSIQIEGLTGTGGSVSNLGSSFPGTAGSSTLTLRGSNAYSYDGTIIDGTYSGSNQFQVALTVDMGAGTQTLTGVNTYTGLTTITSGKLVVGSTQGVGSIASAVTVNSGGTLGGRGTVAGVTVKTGGTLAPGASTNPNPNRGLLTVNGNLNLQSGSIFEWTLGTEASNRRGINYDAVAASGNLQVSDAIFKIILPGLDQSNNFWNSDHSWQVFNKGLTGGSGFGSFSVFNSLGNPVSYPGARSFSFNNATGFLNWSVVPEPSGALAAVLLVGGLVRRRR